MKTNQLIIGKQWALDSTKHGTIANTKCDCTGCSRYKLIINHMFSLHHITHFHKLELKKYTECPKTDQDLFFSTLFL